MIWTFISEDLSAMVSGNGVLWIGEGESEGKAESLVEDSREDGWASQDTLLLKKALGMIDRLAIKRALLRSPIAVFHQSFCFLL